MNGKDNLLDEIDERIKCLNIAQDEALMKCNTALIENYRNRIDELKEVRKLILADRDHIMKALGDSEPKQWVYTDNFTRKEAYVKLGNVVAIIAGKVE